MVRTRNAGGCVSGDQTAGCFYAVEVRHADVHQDHVRIDRGRKLECLVAVRRFADELDIGTLVEDHPEPASDQGLVVDDEHANGHGSVPSGKLAATAKPPLSPGPASSEPPKTATRSRMPISP